MFVHSCYHPGDFLPAGIHGTFQGADDTTLQYGVGIVKFLHIATFVQAVITQNDRPDSAAEFATNLVQKLTAPPIVTFGGNIANLHLYTYQAPRFRVQKVYYSVIIFNWLHLSRYLLFSRELTLKFHLEAFPRFFLAEFQSAMIVF